MLTAIVIVALVAELSGNAPADGPVTTAMRAYAAGQITTGKIDELTCPESPEATAGKFRCRGKVAGGTTFRIDAERLADGRIDVKTLYLNPPEDTIPLAIAAYVPGQITYFDCPGNTRGSFECQGALADRGAFKVKAHDGPDRVIVDSVIYDSTHPSAFFHLVEKHLEGRGRVRSVDCPQDAGRPALFDCVATLADGSTTNIRAGVAPDGSPRVYGVVVASAFQNPRWIAGIGIALLAAGAVGIATGVIQLLGYRERSVVSRLAIVPEQPVTVPAAGSYVLHADAPRFSMVFGGLKYSMWGRDTGQQVPLYPSILRPTTSGLTRVRMALRNFHVDRGGEYVLRIDGIHPQRDASKAALLLAHALPARAFIWLFVAICGAGCMVVGLLATILALG